jgi:predicted dehydrogenase
LYDSIVRNHEEPVTAEEGVKVMRIIEAAIQSSIEKKVISL